MRTDHRKPVTDKVLRPPNLQGASPVGPALRAERVSKQFVGNRVLSDFGLTLAPGEVHALMGSNGSGKSTLIKILSGYHEPDPGAIVDVAGNRLPFGSASSSYRLGLRFVHQDLGLLAPLSVLDNFYLGSGFETRLGTVRRSRLGKAAVEALGRVGLDVDLTVPVERLSASERTGLAVAKAIGRDDDNPARVVVLDEPTATLPADEVERLLGIVQSAAGAGIAILYVTHRLDEVYQIATGVTVLRDGMTVATGPTSTISKRDLVELIAGGEVLAATSHAAPAVPASPDRVLDVSNLVAENISGISFFVRRGEVLGIAGLTGMGRETLLGAVFGSHPRDGGEVRAQGAVLPGGRPDRSVQAGLGFLPADRKESGGMMSLTVRENLTITRLGPLCRRGLIRRRSERATTSEWITALDIRPREGAEMKLEALSGGNQQKVVLAKWLNRAPHVLLLDEPTQGVDIAAKATLHKEILRASQGGMAVIVSSSDVDELADLCTRVLVLQHGAITDELTGDRITVAGIAASCFGKREDEK